MAGFLFGLVKPFMWACIACLAMVAVKRLFFHPIASIPGPRLAALTAWYEFYYDAIKPGQYIFKIQELHEKYGPIIRVAPNEVHINDVGFLNTVYAPLSVPRDKEEDKLKSLRMPGGVAMTSDYKLHKIRRNSLAPFFSKRNILSLEHLVAKKVEQLSNTIASHASSGTPVNLSDLFFAFSNDVVTNFLFAHQVDVLADETKAAALRLNSRQLLRGVHLNRHFPWIPDMLESMPHFISKPMMPSGLLDMLDLFTVGNSTPSMISELTDSHSKRVRKEIVHIMKNKANPDLEEKITTKKSVFESIIDDPNLPDTQKELKRLEQEGSILALAGTESPAKTLNIIFYHLLANKNILTKLRAELDTAPDTTSWSQLDRLPYLSAVIEEANRLSFGVTVRTCRIAPEPITYTPSNLTPTPPKQPVTYVIPGGTSISISTLSAHTAPAVFPNPYVFDPDRWLGEEGRERRKYQMAFGKGGYKCMGVELAGAELCLVVAKLVQEFDMELWNTDASDVAFVHDYQISMPRFDSEGVQALVRPIGA